jgi:hypothetical protein
LAYRPLTPFSNELKAMSREENIDVADRAALVKLAQAASIEEVWTKIERSCGKQNRLKRRFFIRDILEDRRLAAEADAWPDYRANAMRARSLAGFLMGCGALFPPIPMRGLSELTRLLKTLASQLDEQARRSPIRISRENVHGSRKYHLFMRLAGLTMKEMFDSHFDSEVALLTNVFFPQADATTDSVRAQRRPSTRNRRSRKAAAAS